jgi:hypothetical protein
LNVQLIRQLHALHSDWSGWTGEPILLFSPTEIAADLARQRGQNSLRFFRNLRANGVAGSCFPSFPTENKGMEKRNCCGCITAALYLSPQCK